MRFSSPKRLPDARLTGATENVKFCYHAFDDPDHRFLPASSFRYWTRAPPSDGKRPVVPFYDGAVRVYEMTAKTAA